MEKLDFQSNLFKSRYSDSFSLPDYPKMEDGSYDFLKMKELILEKEYGYVEDTDLQIGIVEDTSKSHLDRGRGYLCSGKCSHKRILFHLSRMGDTASFPVDLFIPNEKKNSIFVLQLNFLSELPNKYTPLEELIDSGVTLCHVDYKSITSDDDNMEDGCAKLLYNPNKASPAGKIVIWSYVCNQIIHTLYKNGYIQEDKIYIAGHSRLGKTALLSCATDPIYTGCFVNCSGCGGAAIFREKRGEDIEKITNMFPYWFTKEFSMYQKKETTLPFDQHYLIALCYPRVVMVTAASNDEWADTDAQFLACEAASVFYQKQGKTGLEKKEITYGESSTGGEIKFFKRKGDHFFSREDWNHYLSCV